MFEQFKRFPRHNEGKMAGVYIIRNPATSFCYIGSANDLYARKANHMSALRRGVHYNKALQEAYMIDPCFEYFCFQTEDREVAFDIETKLIREFKEKGISFNVADDARSARKGVSLSEETKTKLSKFRTGMKLSAEHVEKVRLANTGKKRTPEFGERMSKINKGRPRTITQLEAMAAANAKKSVKISADGIVYDSILKTSLTLGVSTGTVYKRINSNEYPTWFKIEKE